MSERIYLVIVSDSKYDNSITIKVCMHFSENLARLYCFFVAKPNIFACICAAFAPLQHLTFCQFSKFQKHQKVFYNKC